MRRLVFLALLTLAVTAPALAQDINGVWRGSIEGRRGPQEISFTFKAEGSTLTGSVTTQGRGGPMENPIMEGKIEGSTISFQATQAGRGGEITITYTGTISGTEIKMTRQGRGGPTEFVLKKAS